MSTLIEFPEILKGRWDHLLILSYGVDLPYFENAILRQDFQCRNKIILADGSRFLRSLSAARNNCASKPRLALLLLVLEALDRTAVVRERVSIRRCCAGWFLEILEPYLREWRSKPEQAQNK